MTGRRLAVLAAGAAGIALAAVLVRPLLPGPGASPRAAAPPPVAVPAAGAGPAAIALARAALTCRADRSGRGCGPLAVTRTDAYTPSPGRVVVLLTGTLTTRDGALPTALRVTLTRSGGRWQGRVSLP